VVVKDIHAKMVSISEGLCNGHGCYQLAFLVTGSIYHG